jgi:peptidoglycan hydrolase CwlO-like protein
MAQLPAALKLVEILHESKAAIDDKRQRLISAFAQPAESRAKAQGNDTTLLAKYEKTRAYRSAIAEKGAKTRKKKEAEAAETKKAEEEAKSAASNPPKT